MEVIFPLKEEWCICYEKASYGAAQDQGLGKARSGGGSFPPKI